MANLDICVGLPASGKTTYAVDRVINFPDVTNVNRDDIRSMLFNGFTGLPADEKLVTTIQHTAIKNSLDAGNNVISSDTNLNRRNVKDLVALGKQAGATISFTYFDTHPDVCVERDNGRVGEVGEEVIRNFQSRYWDKKRQLVPRFETLLFETVPRPVPDEDLYVADTSKPKAILVDLDGTLALHDGRNPFDYDALDTDLPNKPVINLVQNEFWNSGTTPLFVSGRPDSHWEQTAEWIGKHVGQWALDQPLIMRKTGDMRKDAIIKREIFDEHVRDNFNVLYCLDDRDQVVKMYRDLGLSVFQVNYGDF